MDFRQFIEKLRDDLAKATPEMDISIREVDKLQGESYTGISVAPTDSNVSAAINAEPFFRQFQEGTPYSAILQELTDTALHAFDRMPSVDAVELSDYGQMKERLVLQVIPQKGNEEMLQGIPHTQLDDLAVVCRFQLDTDERGSSTILVTNQMLSAFGISAEQLMQDAAAIAPEKNPATLRNMSEVIGELSGGLVEIPPSPMWVAAVENGMHGAGVLAYPGFLEQAAEQFGGDFFVLPSSVHEVLLIPDDGEFHAQEFSDMVASINETEVAPADRLSDTAYHYDAQAHIFEKAQDFENRMAEREEPETMVVLLVEPGEVPREVTVGTSLEALQAAVGGNIEAVYPFPDKVALIMNEEGKLEGLPLNRALRDENGDIYDIVAGSFLVTGLTEDSFGSLTPEQREQYADVFRQPEAFVKMGRSIMAIPIGDESFDKAVSDMVKAGDKPKRKDVPER